MVEPNVQLVRAPCSQFIYLRVNYTCTMSDNRGRSTVNSTGLSNGCQMNVKLMKVWLEGARVKVVYIGTNKYINKKKQNDKKKV